MGDRTLSDHEILKFMDSHLLLRVLDFYSKDSNSLKEKKTLLFKTSLFAEQEKFLTEHKEMDEGDSQTLDGKRQAHAKYEEEIKNSIQGFLNLLENFRKVNNFDTTSSMHKKIIEETPLNKVLEYANVLYESGRYTESRLVLSELYQVYNDNKKSLSKVILALWKLYSINLLLNDYKEARVTFSHIHQYIEKLKTNFQEDFRKMNTESSDKMQVDFRQVLVHRGYLLHWSLFLLKDVNSGLETFLNLAFEPEYYNLIENSFCNLFKYLIVITIVSKSKSKVKSLKNTLLSLDYDDEYTRLFKSIYLNFDVESSMRSLKEVSALMAKDYFLKDYVEVLQGKCKEVLLENYVLLNDSVDVPQMSVQFGESSDSTRDYVTKFFGSFYPDDTLTSEDSIIKFSVTNPSSEVYVILFLIFSTR